MPVTHLVTVTTPFRHLSHLSPVLSLHQQTHLPVGAIHDDKVRRLTFLKWQKLVTIHDPAPQAPFAFDQVSINQKNTSGST